MNFWSLVSLSQAQSFFVYSKPHLVLNVKENFRITCTIDTDIVYREVYMLLLLHTVIFLYVICRYMTVSVIVIDLWQHSLSYKKKKKNSMSNGWRCCLLTEPFHTWKWWRLKIGASCAHKKIGLHLWFTASQQHVVMTWKKQKPFSTFVQWEQLKTRGSISNNQLEVCQE